MERTRNEGSRVEESNRCGMQLLWPGHSQVATFQSLSLPSLVVTFWSPSLPSLVATLQSPSLPSQVATFQSPSLPSQVATFQSPSFVFYLLDGTCHCQQRQLLSLMKTSGSSATLMVSSEVHACFHRFGPQINILCQETFDLFECSVIQISV